MATKKINYKEFRDMMLDPDVPESEIAKYLTISNESSAMNIDLKPNPKLVRMSADDQEQENAMQIGNGAARMRRRVSFRKRKITGDKSPVIVSEGDSWFQFPILIQDVIDDLNKKYLVWSVGAAGDTAHNMVFGKPEYLKALKKHRKNVKAFLFSGAGNDIIGEEGGEPVIKKLLRKSTGTDPSRYIRFPELANRMNRLKQAYEEVIRSTRQIFGLSKLPIVIHGYDYAIPGNKNDQRNPIYAKPDQWLGKPMAALNIKNSNLQRGIIKILIDSLYDMLDDVAGNPNTSHVHVVDVRGLLTKKSHWNDEIHATSKDFGRVAKRFDSVIKAAIN